MPFTCLFFKKKPYSLATSYNYEIEDAYAMPRLLERTD